MSRANEGSSFGYFLSILSLCVAIVMVESKTAAVLIGNVCSKHGTSEWRSEIKSEFIDFRQVSRKRAA